MLVQESMVLSGCVGLTVMWVANFKLLAYTGNRGALAHPEVQASSLVWAALLVLPFFPAKSGRQPASSSSAMAALGVLLKLGVFLGLSVVLLAPQGVPPAARHVCYAVYMWMFVSLCLDAAMPLSGALLGAGQRKKTGASGSSSSGGGGLALQPAMDGPYAATSVREFWGRRYNQIVSATLLETVYKPIVQGKWVAPAPPVAPAPAGPGAGLDTPGGSSGEGGGKAAHNGTSAAGVAVRAGPTAAAPAPAGSSNGAGGSSSGGRRPRTSMPVMLAAMGVSFFISGVMHEICIAFMCGGQLEGSFRMLAFFLVQPLLIVAQDAATALLLPKAFRESMPGRLLQTAVTLALVLASAELFWAALESCRIDERGLQEVVGAMQQLVAVARSAGLLPGAAREEL
ncbi:hypothetical protein HYH02_011369 [Chlamydomonas schloesseri]|uniref:Wax synthase domain-containing protein n=1 Tax=Chlamydomonas schloesseri TaxID=2026947 RepID=A0A835W4L5_9CHLO|nr:hypothetical protein HYH02_011369 [Chlamydomonas schloesseri]|eukprot:KAG2437113.1 hypothetical protein HYH02_011369 [Chlamydomonas schloesseri]